MISQHSRLDVPGGVRRVPLLGVFVVIALFTSPVASQHFQIRDDPQGGDCVGRGIGNWDQGTKTCTLTASQTASISIEDDGVTLDGRGLQLRRGPGARAVGVTVQNRREVTVRRLQVLGFNQGILVQGGESNSVVDCSITGSTRRAIVLQRTLGNTVHDNRINSPSAVGITVFWSNDNQVTKNILSLTPRGIDIMRSDHNIVDRNHVQGTGILLGTGIDLAGSSHNTISRNLVRRSIQAGVSIDRGDDNRVFFNRILNNSSTAFFQGAGRDNLVFCNDFEGHTHGVELWGGPNHVWWNNLYATDDARDAFGGVNTFNQPRPVGGNFWKLHTPNCQDANGDRFCDAPYVFAGNQDNLPHVAPIAWINNPEICFLPGEDVSYYTPWEELRRWYDSLSHMVRPLITAISSGNLEGLHDLLSEDVTMITAEGLIEGREAVVARLEERWRCGEARPEIINLGEASAGPTVTEIEIDGCDQKPMRLVVISRYLGEEVGRRIESLILGSR